MFDIDARLKKLRQQYTELQRKIDLPSNDEARDLKLLDARIDELLVMREQAIGGRSTEGSDYQRKLVIEIEETLDGGNHAWSATVRLPDGRVLAGSLSDDMPCSPGDAVQSAGRMLDVELANDQWTTLFLEPKTREEPGGATSEGGYFGDYDG